MTMTLDEAFARLAATLHLGTYTHDSVGGDIHLGVLPLHPAGGVAVALYPGPESDTKHGYDTPGVQYRVRGPEGDYAAGKTRAQHLYDTLHGLGRTTLADGTVCLHLVATTSTPTWLGTDDRGCHEWTVNFRTELRRVTVNRR